MARTASRRLAEVAGKLLAADQGPRIAALDMLGWDTHVNQGAETGRLAQNLAGLAAGLDAMAKAHGAELEAHGGRRRDRVRPHRRGQRQQRHRSRHRLGHAGHGRRGQGRARSSATGPASAQLQDDRDLRVATDSRSVMKGILRDHLGIDAGALGTKVFPDTAALPALQGSRPRLSRVVLSSRACEDLALIVLGLFGCATSGPPLVDMTDIDPVAYQRDLDHCQAIGNGSDAAGPFVAGALIGLSIGGGLGALFGGTGGLTAPVYSVAEGYGTGAGAVAGAAAGAAANTPSSQTSDPAERPTVAHCLDAKGYKVIGGGD